MTIGERIREIRRDQNISQTQLAQAAGLNQPQVSAIEGGRVKPSAKTIEKIATALHDKSPLKVLESTPTIIEAEVSE